MNNRSEGKQGNHWQLQKEYQDSVNNKTSNLLLNSSNSARIDPHPSLSLSLSLTLLAAPSRKHLCNNRKNVYIFIFGVSSCWLL